LIEDFVILRLQLSVILMIFWTYFFGKGYFNKSHSHKL